MQKENVLENNIVHDAYYLITLFNKDKNNITQLQVQKLMYFFEAYYMVKHKEIDKLYDCNFNAWAFGPVATQLYSKLKKYGSGNIILGEEQKEIAESIDNRKKEILKEIYEFFKDFTPMQLVEITHRKNSPWYEVWHKNGEKVVYGEASYIDKMKTRDWFKENFVEE